MIYYNHYILFLYKETMIITVKKNDGKNQI